MTEPNGLVVHGEFSSADASSPATEADARIKFYRPGDTTEYVLEATEGFVITDYVLTTGAAITVTLYGGDNVTAVAGERYLNNLFPADGGAAMPLVTPFHFAEGVYPKIRTSGAGQIDFSASGYIR